MRIGILTLPLHTNYGGIIQAYALQTILQNMGHEVCIINKDIFSLSISDKIIINLKKAIKNIFLGRKEVLFLEDRRKKEYKFIGKNILEFVDTNLNLINVKEYIDVPQTFDAIIVGSDQVWRAQYMNPIENAFFKFAEKWNVKRISYAASFGGSEWKYSSVQTENCKKLVNQFNRVSVREESGVQLCRDYLKIEATHVLDPTMLLPIDEYINIIEQVKDKKEIKDGLFAYVLNYQDTISLSIDKVSKILNIAPFYASTDRRDVQLEKRKTLKMGDWLNCFYKARFVVTDSFHACVFSILFKKPFLVLLNNDGNERIYSLLKMFNLEDRIINSVEEISKQILSAEINWLRVTEMLEEQKSKSIDFLCGALSS